MAAILRTLLIVGGAIAIAFCGFVVLLVAWGLSGYGPSAPSRDISQEPPFADQVGREYRVVGDVSAYAWNDFPDEETILSVTLTPPPGTRNRFVSYVLPMERGQRIRIIGARRTWVLFETPTDYLVVVPGTKLPQGVDIKMRVGSDGIPDRRLYEPIGVQSTPGSANPPSSRQ